MMYTLTLIKAIAESANETEVQDAILVHLNSDEFSDGDCILFDYSTEQLADDESIEEALYNNTPCTYWEIDENGIYHAF